MGKPKLELTLDELEGLLSSVKLKPHPCSIRCLRVGSPCNIGENGLCLECSWNGGDYVKYHAVSIFLKAIRDSRNLKPNESIMTLLARYVISSHD
jgi:hypothetical protein